MALLTHADIGLDPGFKSFYDWCKGQRVPVVIVSRQVTPRVVRGPQLTLCSGMAPTIRAVLSSVLPEDADNIDVIANDVYFKDESDPKSEWNIVWRHPESGHGHDKSKAILPYRDLEDPPTLFFCGDGVSGMFTKYPSSVASADAMGRSFCGPTRRPAVREGDGER